MKILVIGAGATGGYYGGRLALAGRDVTFLVRARRAEQLRRNGLVLRTPAGEQSLTPKLISAQELPSADAFDLILLSVKAYAFDAALDDFAPAVGPQTMILPLLNGMRHLDTLSARFGDHAVLGGLCRIIGDMDADGRVLQMTALNELAYGERSRELTPRIQQVDATLKGCGFDAVLSPDILAAMWVKWMLLASLGSINALTRGSIGAVAAIDALDGIGVRLENRVLNEAISVATAYGYAPDEPSLRMMRQRLTERGSPLESSMYRDLTRGNPVEADQIVGDMVTRARAKNIDTPLLEAAYVQLSVYTQSRHQSLITNP
jgi:2-dehydropantoate 2-reductase